MVRRALVAAAAPVVGLTLGAALFHALGQLERPLWSDEAATYWIVRDGVRDLVQRIRGDGMPPLYYLVALAFTHVFGFGQIALRLPSFVAAVALVPAMYLLARRLAGRRVGLVAAGLTAVSPLVHYYAAEARFYALLQLETVAVMYATARALEGSHRVRWWGLLSLAQAVQLWTHALAVFVLPVPAVVALLVGGNSRLRLAVKAAAAAAVAAITSIPWFLQSSRAATQGGPQDWIVPFWEQMPPAAAIIRSIEVFGFGGDYPRYLSYLGRVPSLSALSVASSLVLVVLALGPWPTRASRAAHRSAGSFLFAFAFLPLVGLWLYSFLVQPLYVVGRYDTIALPAFLILLGVGVDKIFRINGWIGAGVVAVVLCLAALSASTSLGAPPFISRENEIDLGTARHLSEKAAPGDPIVALGHRYLVTIYYLDRANRPHEVSMFPFELADHPGWYSARRMLRDPARLAREGQELAQRLVGATRQGHPVWILMSSFVDVDDYLYRALRPHVAIDEARSRRDIGVLCLVSP